MASVEEPTPAAAAAEEPVAPPAEETKAENGAADAEVTDLSQLTEPARVPKPSRDALLTAEAALKEEIAVIDGRIQAVNKKTRAENDARNGANDGASAARSEMKRLKAARETLIRERQEIYASRDSARASLDAKMNERRDLRSQTKYKTVEEIDKKISELDALQHTTSMPLAQEKALLKEIDELKKSRKLVAQHQSVGASIDDQRRSAEDFGSMIAEKNAQLEAIKKQMDEHGAVLSKIYDKKKDSAVPGLIKERDELRAQKKAKQDEIQALWDDYKSKQAVWKENQNEWKTYKVQRDKLVDIERAARREEARKAREEELAAKTPYEEEMALCEYLVNYLSTTFLRSSASVSEEEEKSGGGVTIEGFDGVSIQNKKHGANEFLSLGGGKKKGKKGHKGPKGAKGGKVVLAVDTIETFSLLKMEPPANLAAVRPTIARLEEKKTWFSTLPRGEIESIAEMNQKFEDARYNSRDRRDRGDRSDKPKGEKKPRGNKGGAAAAPDVNVLLDFPELPAAPKPKPAEEAKGADEAEAEA